MTDDATKPPPEEADAEPAENAEAGESTDDKTPEQLAAEREQRILDAADDHALMMLLEELQQLDRALATRLTRGMAHQVARVVQRFNYAAEDYQLKGSGPVIAALAVCVRRRSLRFAWIERALVTDMIRVAGESGVRRNFVAALRGEDPAPYWLGDAPINIGVRGEAS